MPSLKSQCYPPLSVIHLELQPEIEAQLVAEAEARGLALDRYIEKIVVARSTDPEPERERSMKRSSPATSSRAFAR